MADSKRRQLNRQQIEASLKSAVWNLAPDVLERIDLDTAQDEQAVVKPVFAVRRRIIGALAAVCLCMVVLAGGSYTYQNGKVDSVIGIDVNPSVELSVNKRNKVLEAEALNEDARQIMEGMDLEGVDLNVAVNAVIGSMVTHGYLDDLDNAILVTVSNDSIKKATSLRTSVVNDIQDTLEEKQVKAVVYDQQVIEEEEVKELAKEYGISYGKAYFLKELIEQNSSLTMEDMEKLAPLTMEEIAGEITERSYAVGGYTKVTEETAAAESVKAPTATISQSEEESLSETETSQETSEAQTESTPKEETSSQEETIPQTAPSVSESSQPETEEPVDTSGGTIKVDYVDYENGIVMVHFKTKVKWKNPTVSVKDREGNTYSAKVEDTGNYECEIQVSGLKGGVEYTFVLGGISPKIGKQTTVKGVFETPVIGEGSADPVEDEDENDGTAESTPEASQPSMESGSGESVETEQPSENQTTEAATEPPSENNPPARETEKSTGAEENTTKTQNEPLTGEGSS